jgi:hypothetical protein
MRYAIMMKFDTRIKQKTEAVVQKSSRSNIWITTIEKLKQQQIQSRLHKIQNTDERTPKSKYDF